MPSQQKHSLVASQIKTPASSVHNRPSTVNESQAHSGNKGAGRLAVGTARLVTHNPKPHYPLASRQLKEQGLVIARLCVSDQGLVQEVSITQSSGFQDLDHSAIKALTQWRFSPIAITSTNVSLQCFQTPIQFTLEG